jgi:hypothetical protein
LCFSCFFLAWFVLMSRLALLLLFSATAVHAVWTAVQRISSVPNVTHMIGQGVALSANADVLVVTTKGLDPAEGHGGIASVFRQTAPGLWTLEQQLWPSDGVPSVTLGEVDRLVATSVAITPAGTRILIGVPYDNDARGSSWLFDYDTGEATWTQVAHFHVATALPQTRQGEVVALSDDGLRVAHGAPAAGNTTGIVWVWRFDGLEWTDDPPLLNPVDDTYPSRFGHALAFAGAEGETLLIGAPLADTVVESPVPFVSADGQVFVYAFELNAWEQTSISPLQPIQTTEAAFGSSLAVSENGILVVGGSSYALGRGGAWTFDLATGTALGAPVSATPQLNAQTSLGTSVSLSADAQILVAGAPNEIINTGGFHTFHSNGSTSLVWNHVFYNKGSGTVYEPFEGDVVAISRDGSTVVMGAHRDHFYRGSVWIFQ